MPHDGSFGGKSGRSGAASAEELAMRDDAAVAPAPATRTPAAKVSRGGRW